MPLFQQMFSTLPVDQVDQVDQDLLQRELFQKLFSAAPDPIVIVNNDGKIALVNAETEQKFGFKSEELIRQPLEILMPDRFQQQHRDYLQNYCHKPFSRPMGRALELYAKHKNGSEFPVEISLSPFQIGKLWLVISIIRDISERKAVERELTIKASALENSNLELNRSNQELEQFAYIASHDLQEPLRSIAGSCQMLQKKLGANTDDSMQEFIDFAVEGSKRMQDLINDLLSYSRVTTKAKEPKPTDCHVIMKRVLASLKTAIDDAKVQLRFGTLPVLLADHTQLVQLFQNLIGNAIKFRSEHQPLVVIDAIPEGDFWLFSISDNGIGIEPKYFERIFEIFKRLHSREKYPGTGMGLATCKKIVERHGGRIWLQSTLGQGTTFYFTLPKQTE